MKKWMIAVLAGLLTCSAFTMGSCGKKDEGDVAAVKAAGKLIVGVTEYEPMDYRDENGKWIGFDAEFAEMFAEKLGVTAEFVIIDWDNKLMEVSSGAIDCIWNGMTITNEITAACAVSNPYIKNQQVVVMKADAAASYKTLDDMKDLSFATEAGSAGETILKDAVADGAAFGYTSVSDQSAALMEVASGSVDACVIDGTMAASMTGAGTSYADLAVAAELSNEEYGVAFRQNSDLCDEFNAFMKEAKLNGSLAVLAEKYGLTLAE